MKQNSSSSGIDRRAVLGVDRRALLSTLAVLPALSGTFLPTTTRAATGPANGGFSFAACDDTRPMMYLPQNADKPDLTKLFRRNVRSSHARKVAEEVVKRDVKMIFDPVTKELIQIIMPFMTKTEVMTLTVDNGWVTEASVEDIKLLPGVHRVMFRLQGGDWVAREIVNDVQAGRAKFVVNSGDVVWWGNQGLTVEDSPYWKRVNNTMLKQLPAPDDRDARGRGSTGGGSSAWAITRCGAIPRSRARCQRCRT